MNQPMRPPSTPPLTQSPMQPTQKPPIGKKASFGEAPWAFAKDFADAEAGICVRVNSRTLPPRFSGAVPLTEYSWELLRVNKERVSRFFAFAFIRNMAAVQVENPFDSGRFCELVAEAEAWTRAERQAREDKIVEQRAEKEARLAGRGK